MSTAKNRRIALRGICSPSSKDCARSVVWTLPRLRSTRLVSVPLAAATGVHTDTCCSCALCIAAHRWRFAFPYNALSQKFLLDETKRLGVCGDWCAGARVEGRQACARCLVMSLTSWCVRSCRVRLQSGPQACKNIVHQREALTFVLPNNKNQQGGTICRILPKSMTPRHVTADLNAQNGSIMESSLEFQKLASYVYPKNEIEVVTVSGAKK